MRTLLYVSAANYLKIWWDPLGSSWKFEIGFLSTAVGEHFVWNDGSSTLPRPTHQPQHDSCVTYCSDVVFTCKIKMRFLSMSHLVVTLQTAASFF